MPSINEVWEQAQQANAHLAVLHNDMVKLEECCQEVVAGVDELVTQTVETNDWLESTRELLLAGFQAMIQQQAVTNHLLLHGIRQRDAQICQLEQASERLCRLLDIAAHEERHLEVVAAEVPTIRQLLAHVAPDAALAVADHDRLQKQLDACCPPAAPDPACVHKPCEKPAELDREKLASAADHVAEPAGIDRRARAWVRDRPQ